MKRNSVVLAASAAIAALSAGAGAETTVVGDKGPSSTSTPYLLPVAPGVRTVAILTTGDTVNPKLNGATPYRFVGIPDGTGGFDNGDGTFTMTVNHEIGITGGIARVHGGIGAFVTILKIDSKTLAVQSANDLIRILEMWDPATQAYVQGAAAFDRFCSADVPAVTAFWDPATKLGTTERFHMNGEETAGGRAMAHLITGPNAGVSTELPKLGKQAWENVIACPFPQAKTIVACDDDTTPGQVFIYVGTKLATGTDVQKAGLSNGKLYGVIANNARTEDRTTGIGLAKGVGGAFTLVELPDQAAAGANTETAADALNVTEFLRPEDGAWDPSHPEDFYFVTTDQFDQVKDGQGATVGRTRLWKLHFADITNPTAGGTITMLLDGSEAGQMWDNICIDRLGHILLEEDVGGNAHNGKIWQFTIATGALTLLAKHDPARFGDNGLAATAPFNNDEEATGIFDASDLLGPGWFLSADQAHFSPGDTELFQGGQIFALFNPDSVGPPTISAAASASRTNADVGETVAFDVSASEPGGGALTYAWDFGDGATATTRTTSHAYATTGAKTAKVTVTHTVSGKAATSQVIVTVQRPSGPMSLAITLNFAKPNKDTLLLTAQVPVAAGFNPAGKVVTCNIGGVQRTFTLGANGLASPVAGEVCKVVVKKTKGAVLAQRATLTVSIKNAALAASFVDEGLTNATASAVPVAVTSVLTFDGRTQSDTQDLIYTATVGKSGAAK